MPGLAAEQDLHCARDAVGRIRPFFHWRGIPDLPSPLSTPAGYVWTGDIVYACDSITNPSFCFFTLFSIQGMVLFP